MRRTSALALAALALVAAGCGKDAAEEEASDPTLSSSAIKGTGYAYEVPEGWAEPAEPIVGFDPDSIARDEADEDGFMDNINVLLSPSKDVTPEQVETTGVQELETAGASDISVEDRVTIAGEESAHLSAQMPLGTDGYTIDQFYVNGEDQTFIVTFSFSSDLSAEERAAVTGPTLASWTWTD